MPVATKARNSKTVATFKNDYAEDCTLRVVPNTRRTKMQVVWSCGDEYIFATSALKELVDFFGNGKKKIPAFVCVDLRRYYNAGDTQDHSFSRVRIVQDGDGKVMLFVDDYGRAVDWLSFVVAFKSLM